MTKTASKAHSPLRARMIERMRIGNLSAPTQKHFLRAVSSLARDTGTAPDRPDAEQVRAWVLGLIGRDLAPASTNATLSAPRFFCCEVIDRPDIVRGLRNRKRPRPLPRPSRYPRNSAQPADALPHFAVLESAACLVHEMGGTPVYGAATEAEPTQKGAVRLDLGGFGANGLSPRYGVVPFASMIDSPVNAAEPAMLPRLAVIPASRATRFDEGVKQTRTPDRGALPESCRFDRRSVGEHSVA